MPLVAKPPSKHLAWTARHNAPQSTHSCQPAEFVIPNGGGFGEAEENRTHAQGREANCSLQNTRCSTKSENARECWLRQADVLWHLRNTGVGGGGKGRIFSIQKQNSSFGNLYSNLDFLIVITTKNLGGLAAMLSFQTFWSLWTAGEVLEKK